MLFFIVIFIKNRKYMTKYVWFSFFQKYFQKIFLKITENLKIPNPHFQVFTLIVENISNPNVMVLW